MLRKAQHGKSLTQHVSLPKLQRDPLTRVHGKEMLVPCVLQLTYNVHVQSRSKIHVLMKPILSHPVFCANSQSEHKYSNSLAEKHYGISIYNCINDLSWYLTNL